MPWSACSNHDWHDSNIVHRDWRQSLSRFSVLAFYQDKTGTSLTWPDYDSWLMILTTSHYHYHRWRCLKLVKHIACITLSKTGSRLASCARRHKAVSWLFTKLLTGLVGQLWVSKTHRRHHITEWSGAAAGSHGNISLHNNHWNHRLTAWRESRPACWWWIKI